MGKQYKLLDMNGRVYLSATKGTMGGHRGLKIYGRLDCPSALRFIAQGKYIKFRIFFADAMTAVAAGYRPCGHCLKAHYEWWRDYRAEWLRLVAECREECGKHVTKAVSHHDKSTNRGAGSSSTPKARPQRPKTQAAKLR